MFQKVFKPALAMVMALSMLLTCGNVTALAAGKSAPAYHSPDAIRERGVLTVAVNGNARFDYLIPNDPEKYGDLAGTRDGIVSELCRRIAQELGVEAAFVEYETVADQLNAAAAGDVDIAAGNFVINEARLALYEMTDSFDIIGEDGHQIFLSTKPESGKMIRLRAELDHADIAVVKASVQANNTAIQYPEAKLLELTDNQAVQDALAAGKVQAAVFVPFDQTFAEQLTQAIQKGTIVQSNYMVAAPDYRGYGLVLMKGNRELRQYINTLLYNLTESGWLQETYKNEELESIDRGIITESSTLYQDIKVEAADCPSLAFSDLDTGKWYHRYVDYVIEHGLMGDAGGGLFAPDRTLTRAQVVTVLWQLEGKPQTDYAMDFDDVAEGQWYTETVRWAVSEKVMEGNGDGTFGPNNPITWEQLAAILRSYAVYKGYDVSAKGDPSIIADASKISSWASDAMQWACGADILESTGILNPTGSTTRCEFAAAITKFMEHIVTQ